MSLDYLLFFCEKLVSFFGVMIILTLVGHILFFKKKLLGFKNLFFSLFAGITIVSSLTALIYTSLTTIHSVFVLLAIFVFVETKFFPEKTKIEVNKNAKSSTKMLLLACLIGGTLIFSWSFFQYTKQGDFSYRIPAVNHLQANDYIINSLRSHFMTVSGSENYFHAISLIDKNYQGVKPYHYFEMWMNAGITDLIGGLNAANFSLITFPLLHFLAFLGVLSLWEAKARVHYLAIAFSLILLLFAGLHTGLYDYLGVKSTNLPVMSYRLKMAVYYPFIFGFLIEFTSGSQVKSMLFLLGLTIATIVTAPGIVGGIALFLALAAVFGLANKKDILRSVIYLSLTTTAIISFYIFSSAGGPDIREGVNADNFINRLFVKGDLIETLKEKSLLLGKELVRFLFFFWPFLFLIAKLRSRLKSLLHLRHLMTLSVCILFISLCAYLFFAPQTDALQLSYNLFISVMNSLVILLSIVITSSFDTKKAINKKERVSFVILILLIITSGILQTKPFLSNVFFGKPFYSDAYLNQVKGYFIDETQTCLVGTINDTVDFHSSFSYQVAAYSGGYYLAFMKNGVAPISLSDMKVIPTTSEEKRDLSNGVFHNYVTNQQASGDYICIEESQLSFIKENEIKYLVLSANSILSGVLKNHAQTIITDKLSKERFVILK